MKAKDGKAKLVIVEVGTMAYYDCINSSTMGTYMWQSFSSQLANLPYLPEFSGLWYPDRFSPKTTVIHRLALLRSNEGEAFVRSLGNEHLLILLDSRSSHTRLQL